MDMDDAKGCFAVIGLGFVIFFVFGTLVNISSCIWPDHTAEKEAAEARAAAAEARAAEARAAEARRLAEEEAAAEARRLAEEAAERHRREVERRRREAARADKLRTFALQDAPGIWRAYQQLEAAIAEQNARIKDLEATLREFDKVPDADVDYKAICAVRDNMIETHKDIWRKLEEAYLASCRFKATPNRGEYAELMRKALDDGMRAADAATRKFEQMRMEK